MAEDLANVTGNREYGRSASMAYAIYYKNLVIDTVRYQHGIIDSEALQLSRHIRWEHAKRHNEVLSKNMLQAGYHRPKNVAAHHVVAWDHPRAAKARIRLAAYAIDIDDECNGVYLPRYQKHCPHAYLPNAEAHSKSHTDQYFFNVEFLLEATIAERLGRNAVISTLRDVASDLKKGDFPLTTRFEHA
ncbi:A nuclease family of the HNH/ENDO VII superfamily with conserved AHH [Rheinheimera pacifica]|uniref:A nuclease family of the HNH/ENDO VII superfamily with conserved AHH n=2 Tax=Rheinheimera pacifica TaxID=173990 RepID=A0A1H6NLQ7_9GAMM|nr:A nuclease family of the HNH/ENDO VII superfamily with conserved AHH [Rheinheimera pacifica]